MAFHFLDTNMMKKITTSMIIIKTGICRNNMIPSQDKGCVNIGKNIENGNSDGARFGRPNIKEKIKRNATANT